MKESIGEMLDEIAASLKAGDEGVHEWLRDQLEESGASEVVVELTMGIVARLTPRQTPGAIRTKSRGGRRNLH